MAAPTEADFATEAGAIENASVMEAGEQQPNSSNAERSAPRVLVTIATYNEIENLPLLVDEIFAQSAGVDILVVDDNSPDGTGRWCDERAEQDHRVKCSHRSGKLGLGTATVAAMRYAIEHDYDYMLNLDADFSHHPRYVPDILKLMEEQSADVAIGSRYVPGGGTEGWPWRRRAMSRGVNTFARLTLGLDARDCSGAFRCYRVSLLRQLDFDQIISTGYSFQEEILWRLKRLGATFAETPIVFEDRRRGKSKIDLREAVQAVWVMCRLGITRLVRR